MEPRKAKARSAAFAAWKTARQAAVTATMLFALRGCGGDVAMMSETVACEPACSGRCEAGRCIVTLAYGQNVPHALVVDATSVYWTNFGGGEVMKAPLGGGPPTTLAVAQSWPWGLAVDSTSVYWTNNGDGTVAKVPIAGGVSTTLAAGSGAAGAISLDATRVYWASRRSTERGVVVDASLRSVPIDGGTPTEIAVAYSPWALTINATSIFWSDETVMSMPLDGGLPTHVVEHYGGGATAIAVDATSVYWSLWESYGHGHIMRAPIDGGVATMLATDQEYPVSMAVDATSLYWTNGGPDGTVMRLSLRGGNPVVLASAQDSPGGIAVDSTSVYWTNTSGGTVMKVTPK